MRFIIKVCVKIFSSDVYYLYLVSLTLGLMGLDELHLRVLATSSEDLTQRRNAQKGKDEIISSFRFVYIHYFFYKKKYCNLCRREDIGS